jgi:hypothetical protein
MAAQTDQFEELRNAVLGNERGREVEVDPTGEIRTTNEEETRSKPSKMCPHTFS